MNNTDKLLRAFIEASGYEVKEISPTITKERREFLESENMLFTLAVEEGCDYKVTKKPVDTSMADAWVKDKINRGTFR